MMDFNSVKGKVAIVTGASRGIGRAIAECFGENGMKVVCAARSAEQGQAVADGICAKGGDAHLYPDRLQQGFCHQGTGGQDGGTLRQAGWRCQQRRHRHGRHTAA